MSINKAAVTFLTAFFLLATGAIVAQYVGEPGDRRELILDYPPGTRPDASLMCLGCTARGPSPAWTAMGLDIADGGIALAWAEVSFDPAGDDPGFQQLPAGIETTGCVERFCDPDPPMVHVWRHDVAPWPCSCPSARDGRPIPMPCVAWGGLTAPAECCEDECQGRICNVGHCGGSCGTCPSGLWCRAGTECVEPCEMDESQCPRDAGEPLEVPVLPEGGTSTPALPEVGTSTP